MADEVPISRDITDIPVVTSGLDRPENKDLKAAFDAWDPAPVEEEAPPSAPVEVEAAETGETRTATKPETDVQQEAPAEEVEKKETNFEQRVKRAPSDQDIKDDLEPPKVKTDVDFESMELRPDAPENQKSQFRQLKEITQKFSAEAKAYRAKLSPLLKEFGLGELPDNPADVEKALEQFGNRLKERPEIPAEERSEIETLRTISRASALDKSLTYSRGYIQPIKAAWSSLIDDIAGSLPASPEVRSWAEGLKNHDPRKATSAWYQEHLALVPDGIARQRIATKIGQLSELQQTADRVATEIAGSGDLFKQWQQVENEQAVQKIKSEFEMAAQRCFQGSHKRLAEWQTKKEEGVTDPKELSEIRAHNAKFVQRENRFKQILTNLWSEDRWPLLGRRLNYIEMEERFPYRCRWNCLMAAGLDDDRLISAIMSLESLKLHESKIEKRREAKQKQLPTTFRVEFPAGRGQ